MLVRTVRRAPLAVSLLAAACCAGTPRPTPAPAASASAAADPAAKLRELQGNPPPTTNSREPATEVHHDP